jgi:hypothetical protein
MMSGRRAASPENQEDDASSRNSLKQRVGLQPPHYARQRVPRFVQMGGPRFPDWPKGNLPFLPVERCSPHYSRLLRQPAFFCPLYNVEPSSITTSEPKRARALFKGVGDCFI